jgi:hypothetical protein
MKYFCCMFILGLGLCSAPVASQTTSETLLSEQFKTEVKLRLRIPEDELLKYAALLQTALNTSEVNISTQQFVVLIDRNMNVQAALLYLGSNELGWKFVGASPVSTGLPGRYEHFTTPLGVFSHDVTNPDFRAEGTKNKLGFRGYGLKDLRIYDFGWVKSPRGWGDGSMGELRLQMHSTDPDLAEPRLGTAQSEGCVRIHSTLNEFIDRYAVLDQDYEQAIVDGANLWVIRSDTTPTDSSGRYMVVVDSEREKRPTWARRPVDRHKKGK